MPCDESSFTEPSWLAEVLEVTLPGEGDRAMIQGISCVRHKGILRTESLFSNTQKQTQDSFAFKWKKRDTFDSEASREGMRVWLLERYGDLEKAEWWKDYGDRPLVVDAGCGAGFSALELFGPLIPKLRYLCCDISEAIDVAATRFKERKLEAGFLQADLLNLPIPENSVDVIFSEGVLHHTDSTENALKALVKLLKPGGRFLFYVYRLKGPVREFTDDYIREKIRSMPSEEAWENLIPLTRLGQVLGELNLEIDIPEDIDLLKIPAGKINLQRFFYWHVAKTFYRPDLTLDEMNHINFDWYAPSNAHRQSPEDVRKWCEEAHMEIEREILDEPGITIIAKKTQ